MMRKSVVAVALVLAFVAGACKSEQDKKVDVAREKATAAMKKAEEADNTMPAEFEKAFDGVLSAMPQGPKAVVGPLRKDVMPVLEKYSATLDDAIASADAYLALQADPESKKNVEISRGRAKALHAAMDQMKGLADKIDSGQITEATQVATELQSIGTALTQVE